MFRYQKPNPYFRRMKQLAVWSLTQSRATRSLLNNYYGSFTLLKAADFYRDYAKIFRKLPSGFIDEGEWIVSFLGKSIKLPLRGKQMWLDWDLAISLIGHDIEIKQTYVALLSSCEKPDLFLDIGANYGTHSVLMLSHGIPVVSFEPNPSCMSYHLSVCRLNGIESNWEGIGLGASDGLANLVFPEKETWLGSVSSNSPQVETNRESNSDFRSIAVQIRRLDDFIEEKLALADECRLLIKIDVEGAEMDVLRGALTTLRFRRPKIIFESNDSNKRGALMELFIDMGYVVSSLPWSTSAENRILSPEVFVDSPEKNFLALPR